MVHKNIFRYFSQHRDEEMVVTRSIHDILQDIRIYRQKYNKAAKVLISLRAFEELYNVVPDKVIFGYRIRFWFFEILEYATYSTMVRLYNLINKIKSHFARILKLFTHAGAELIFVSKDAPSKDNVEVPKSKLNEKLTSAKMLLEIIENMEDPIRNFYVIRKDLSKLLRRNLIIPLAQVAQKFGNFLENDCLVRVSTAGHVQTANNEDVFALIGNENAYLSRPGSWRYLSPARFSNSQFNSISNATTSNFNFLHFLVDACLVLTLKKYFELEVDGHYTTDFPKIATFVHKFAPPEKFPLELDVIEEMSKEIFGYSDDALTASFMDSIQYGVYFYENACRFEDMEVNLLLTNDPFSSLAENILNGLPILITSPFLDATATDMKPLKDLTIGWIKRFAGVMLKYVEKPKKFNIVCQKADSGELEHTEIEAEAPDFVIPTLKQLISEEIDEAEKFKILAFIIDNIIAEKDLKTIPPDYLMHVIIIVQLMKHNFMTLIEATAMTNAMLYNSTSSFLTFIKKINIGAFRISVLYQKMYSILLMCLSPIGLKSFTAELTIDNVQFQNIYTELNDWSTAYKCDTDENPFDLIMEIVNR